MVDLLVSIALLTELSIFCTVPVDCHTSDVRHRNAFEQSFSVRITPIGTRGNCPRKDWEKSLPRFVVRY